MNSSIIYKQFGIIYKAFISQYFIYYFTSWELNYKIGRLNNIPSRKERMMEAKLIEKSIKGDVASFELLIQKYRQYVYNIAYRMMGNSYDADDMAQEALIKAYKAIHQFKGDSQFSTWLYRIAMNTCKDELRRRKEALPLDDGIDTLTEAEKSKSDPLIIYEQKELQLKVQSALNKLSVDGKEVIILRDIMGYSYEEIGNMLQIPIGTVRSRINRNRSMLKDILRAEA